MTNKEDLVKYYESMALERIKWTKRNCYYHRLLQKYYSLIIPEGSRVLEIGCGTGDLLNAVSPSYGVGIDISDNILKVAKLKYPNYNFYAIDAADMKINETFDYIILSDLIGSLWDVQKAFHELHKVCHKRTKIVISYYNYLWEPILKIAEKIGLKLKQPLQNWLSPKDIINLLEIEGFECVKQNRKILLPKRVPVLNFLFNNILANLPIFDLFCLTNLLTARLNAEYTADYNISIIIPARNEKGNIENVIVRTPKFGQTIEFVFVEGNSNDGTYEEMIRVKEKYPEIDIFVMKQSGKGKGNAVREGFDLAKGEILMILDADLTMPPEDLPKYYEVLKSNKGEFINGCRLVYPMEKQAMRFLNLIGNKFFSVVFTYLLNQQLKDTLCGTKVLFKSHYLMIKENRKHFGDFDPFGDFDLLFGAAKLNLKIVEVPIRYKEREYGSTQISRFANGWLLIKMCLFAAKKLKFN